MQRYNFFAIGFNKRLFWIFQTPFHKNKSAFRPAKTPYRSVEKSITNAQSFRLRFVISTKQITFAVEKTITNAQSFRLYFVILTKTKLRSRKYCYKCTEFSNSVKILYLFRVGERSCIFCESVLSLLFCYMEIAGMRYWQCMPAWF